MVVLGLSVPSSLMHFADFGSSKELLWLASISSGIFMCIVVYQVTGVISRMFYDEFDKFKRMQQVEWKNRGFSTFHAIIVAVASFYLLLLSGLFQEDSHEKLMIYRTSTLSDTILGISTGYFLFDMAMIFWHFPALGGWEYVLHHGLSMLSIILSLFSGQAQIYILMVLFSESTTPFVNMRWYLDVAGQKNSKLYLYNGILLFLGWLVARILLFIIFFIHMAVHFDQVKQTFDFGFYTLLVAPPTLAVMNLFWFWKIARGLVKNLTKARHSQ